MEEKSNAALCVCFICVPCHCGRRRCRRHKGNNQRAERHSGWHQRRWASEYSSSACIYLQKRSVKMSNLKQRYTAHKEIPRFKNLRRDLRYKYVISIESKTDILVNSNCKSLVYTLQIDLKGLIYQSIKKIQDTRCSQVNINEISCNRWTNEINPWVSSSILTSQYKYQPVKRLYFLCLYYLWLQLLSEQNFVRDPLGIKLCAVQLSKHNFCRLQWRTKTAAKEKMVSSILRP